MNQTNHKPFYDLEKVKQVPILEVCNTFGIELERKGGSIWCKLRSERTASAIIHPDTNTFHDFGTNETSDAIGLVSVFEGISRYDAMQKIAGAFFIEPENPRAGMNANDLTVWEYAKIGLDGKMATKNFDFDLAKQGIARVSELSLLYGMPMNVLKKNHPRIYERLLKQRAIPHVKNLRNDYYMDVFSKYNLAKAVGSEKVFYNSAQNGEFAAQIEELRTAERILERACKGTQITAHPVGEYDPVADLDKLLKGEVKIALGTDSYMELKSKSEKENSPVKYRTVDFTGFMNAYTQLSVFPHSAFMKDGNVVVGFLEKDFAGIKPVLDKIRINSKGSLNQKISQAQQWQETGRCTDSSQKGPFVKNSKGEER